MYGDDKCRNYILYSPIASYSSAFCLRYWPVVLSISKKTTIVIIGLDSKGAVAVFWRNSVYQNGT